MQRNTQKDPDPLIAKNCLIYYVMKILNKVSYQPADFITFDETYAWADMVSMDVVGKK